MAQSSQTCVSILTMPWSQPIALVHLQTYQTDSYKQVLVGALLCIADRKVCLSVCHMAEAEPGPGSGVWDCWDSWLLPPGPT